MATPLGSAFSAAENQVSQCDDQTLGSIVEIPVINFDQDRFELVSGGSTSPLHVRKHRNVSIARAPLTTSWKQVSVEINKALCKPIIVSDEAKQALCESSTVSAETNIASRQHVNTMREAIKVPHEPKTTSPKAMWIAKSVVSCEAKDISLDSVSCETKIVSDCKTISALHRAKPRLFREAKVKAFYSNSETTATSLTLSSLFGSARLTASGKIKALSVQIASSCEANSTLCRVQSRLSRVAKAKTPLCANSVADSASLSLPAPNAKVFSHEGRTKALSAKNLSREVKNEAPLSANSETSSASLKRRALHSKAKLAFKSRAKIAASPCEATLSGGSYPSFAYSQKEHFEG